jgi:hypothetical protein
MLIERKADQTSSTNFHLKISMISGGGEKTIHGCKKKPINKSTQKLISAIGADLYSNAKPSNTAEENTINGKIQTIIP